MKPEIGAREVAVGSRRWNRRFWRSIWTRRYNTPPEPTATPAGGPSATPASPTPAAPVSPPPPPAAPSTPATPAPSPAAGPGTSGLPAAGATPSPATPAPPAALTFEQELQQRFGVNPDHLRTLLPLGYRAYQQVGQPQPAPAPAPANQPEPKKNIFGLPEFDHRLLDFIGKRPDGSLELLPGAPPDALLKVQQFQAEFQRAQREFYTDPMKFLAPAIEELAARKAQETYEKQFGQHRGQETARQILAENASWLYERDANGQIATFFNPATAQEEQRLSPWGQLYQQQVNVAAQMGLNDPESRHRFAKLAVENIAMRQQMQQGGAAANGAAAAQQFLNTAARPGTPAAPVPPVAPATPVVATPGGQGMSLRQMLDQAFTANGITDESIRRDRTLAG